MKLLHGTPAEVDHAAELVSRVFTVVSISGHYPDRGASTLVRVYVETRMDPGETRPRWQATRADQPPAASGRALPKPPQKPRRGGP